MQPKQLNKLYYERASYNVMCYQSSWISRDTKEQTFQCNVLLKQVDLKKGHPTNHSKHGHKIKIFLMNIYEEMC